MAHDMKTLPGISTSGEPLEGGPGSLDSLAILERFWGYPSFRPLQEEAIARVLGGSDSVVVLPTGGGKSLCYQVPAVQMGRLAVVVSPLISLMKDQVDALRACGIASACINSSLSAEERRRVAAEMRAGTVRLLYVAPERLVTPGTLDFLAEVGVAFFAIDEAHCISQWGHDFRPEYRQLHILKERFPHVGVHAFTATATQRVREDIAAQLGLVEPEFLVGDFDRPNLTYRAIARGNRLPQVMEVIERHKGESGIIYCISRRAVDELTATLRERGLKAAAYHAGLSDGERHRNQEAFLAEKVDLIVATVAFGMGIDKSNVRFVLHTGMPKSLEHYQQEAGRAGRDGLESECVLLYSGADIVLWKQILSSSENVPESAMRSLASMADFCASVVCRHKQLVEYFGQPFGREDCGGHCDVCRDEIRLMEDALTISRKILSGIVRTGQRFGAGYVASTLVAETSERIQESGHDRLSTFGILKEYGKRAVRNWIDQLILQGFLQKALPFRSVQLTPAGRELLQGTGNPKLLVPAEPAAKRKKREAGAAPADDWEGVDRPLFERLRQLRSEVAEERGVPPYVIFADTTLRELARQRPSRSDLLLLVRGIGEQKRQEFGERVLAVIDAYCDEFSVARDVGGTVPPPPPPAGRASRLASAEAAYPLFRAGRPIGEIQEELQRSEATVMNYMTQWIEEEKVTDISAWVMEETAERIRAAAREVGDRYLKPIREVVGEEISYAQIRIVVARDRVAAGLGASRNTRAE